MKSITKIYPVNVFKIVRTTYSYFHICFLAITEQLGGSSADHFSLVFHVLDTENNKFTAQTGGNRLGFGLTYKVLVLLNTHNPKLIICVSRFPNTDNYFF